MKKLKTKLRPELKKFALAKRPLIIDPDLAQLFVATKIGGHGAIVMALIVQRVAHLSAQTKSLDLKMQEFFDLFPFVDSRNLRRNIYRLRKHGIWSNKKYIPHSGMASYTDIKISWAAVSRLAEKVQKDQS